MEYEPEVFTKRGSALLLFSSFEEWYVDQDVCAVPPSFVVNALLSNALYKL